MKVTGLLISSESPGIAARIHCTIQLGTLPGLKIKLWLALYVIAEIETWAPGVRTSPHRQPIAKNAMNGPQTPLTPR